jgi:hypothetical protein
MVDKESDLFYNPTPLSNTEPANDPSRASEAPEGTDFTHGIDMMLSHSEGGTPAAPRFGDDTLVPERRRTRGGGGF